MIASVILRIVHARPVVASGKPPPDRARPRTPDEARAWLARAASRVNGLETLVVGWSGAEARLSGAGPRLVVTVWRDAESMLAAIGRDEGAFHLDRLGLAIDADPGDTYEVVSRTFGSLPAPSSVLRVLTMTASRRAEAGLFERIRQIQRELTDHGLIASHVARRMTPEGLGILVVGVWIDHAAIERATGGRPERPVAPDEIEPWIESIGIEVYDALEIAPRLPMASGPPIVVIDGSRRVVDLTPAAAAALGRTQEEAVGALVEDLAAPGNRDAGERWRRLLEPDETAGEVDWALASGGHVMIRWRLRRDAPVQGRHTILVRRRHEPEPTAAELDAALTEAFPLEPTLAEG
jgi:PAS domain-containing protein